MKLGILGGTFNPIHNGHLYIALETAKKLLLDEVYLVPSYNPPHKPEDNLASYFHRYKMLHLAVNNYPNLYCSDLDYTPGEKSYTKYLILRFRKHFPDAQLYFIIGADNISQLTTWHDYRWLLDNINFASVTRSDYEQTEKVDYYDKITLINVTPLNVSSQSIRKRISKKEDITGLVPAEVKDYIAEHKLYYTL